MACAFSGSGYKRVIIDEKYSAQNTQLNLVVYSQLEVQTVGGTSHHLIKPYEDDKNFYGAWNALCEWSDDAAVKNKPANYFKSNLESYRITLASNVAQCINNFLTSFLLLKKNPGEAISESHALSLFHRGVKDPGFEMTVEIQKINMIIPSCSLLLMFVNKISRS